MNGQVRTPLPALLRDRFRPSARIARRFARNEDGVTAVEFGFISIPFFALLLAIFETAMVLWSTQLLENAVSDASRKIYTGQFQTANAATPPAQLPQKFREEICKSIVAMFTCDDIKVDVRTLDSFPDNTPGSPLTNGAVDPAKFGKYEAPQANKVVVVRALVEYPVFVSLLNPNQANLANGKRLLIGTTTFKTEPYSQ